MKNQSGTIKTNLELNRVVMGGSGGYRRLPGGSDDFSLQTLIIIYISPSSPSKTMEAIPNYSICGELVAEGGHCAHSTGLNLSETQSLI